jgi:hypothetical protein
MNAADERALAAADKAHAKFAIQGCVEGHAVGSFRVGRGKTLVFVVVAGRARGAGRKTFSRDPAGEREDFSAPLNFSLRARNLSSSVVLLVIEPSLE